MKALVCFWCPYVSDVQILLGGTSGLVAPDQAIFIQTHNHRDLLPVEASYDPITRPPEQQSSVGYGQASTMTMGLN